LMKILNKTNKIKNLPKKFCWLELNDNKILWKSLIFPRAYQKNWVALFIPMYSWNRAYQNQEKTATKTMILAWLFVFSSGIFLVVVFSFIFLKWMKPSAKNLNNLIESEIASSLLFKPFEFINNLLSKFVK